MTTEIAKKIDGERDLGKGNYFEFKGYSRCSLTKYHCRGGGCGSCVIRGKIKPHETEDNYQRLDLSLRDLDFEELF